MWKLLSSTGSSIVIFSSKSDALISCSQFHINASYPRIWNMPQTWQCELEVYKATYHFIFAQKSFFTGNFFTKEITYQIKYSFFTIYFQIMQRCMRSGALISHIQDNKLFLRTKFLIFSVARKCLSTWYSHIWVEIPNTLTSKLNLMCSYV